MNDSAHHTCSPNPNTVVTLTENQRDILLRLFAGSPIAEIARQTDRSTSTISNTLRLVRKQLRAGNDVDLLRESLRQHVVTLEEICQLANERYRARCSMTDEHGRA